MAIAALSLHGQQGMMQQSACSTEEAPRTHLLGMLVGCHPYLRHKASQKSPLWSVNPSSSIGSAVCHFSCSPVAWLSEGVWEVPFLIVQQWRLAVSIATT